MKKQLFILAAAALALASCSNDETIESVATSPSNEISFRTFVDGVTRSTAGPMAGTSFAEGDVINVYAAFTPSGGEAAKYFQADFTKQSGSDGFTSTAKYYWPAFASGDKMTFTAIYGATHSTTTVGMVDDFTPTAIASGGDEGKMMDLLVAKKEVTAKEDKVVLNFRHALSQIVVNVKNSNAALDFDVTGVRIGFVSTQGDFTYSGGVTTAQEEDGHTTPTNTLVAAGNWSNLTPATPTATNKYDQTWTKQAITTTHNDATALSSFLPKLLIPQTQTAANAYAAATQGTATSNPTLNGSYIALELEIYNYNGTARSNKLVAKQWCYWPCDFTWNPGYKYTYTVDLAGGGYQPINTESASTELDKVLGDVIVFSPSCTIDYWVTPAANNVTMP